MLFARIGRASQQQSARQYSIFREKVERTSGLQNGNWLRAREIHLFAYVYWIVDKWWRTSKKKKAQHSRSFRSSAGCSNRAQTSSSGSGSSNRACIILLFHIIILIVGKVCVRIYRFALVPIPISIHVRHTHTTCSILYPRHANYYIIKMFDQKYLHGMRRGKNREKRTRDVNIVIKERQTRISIFLFIFFKVIRMSHLSFHFLCGTAADAGCCCCFCDVMMFSALIASGRFNASDATTLECCCLI